MNEELYQKKYKYERLIKDINDICTRLQTCYSNLILSKKKIFNNVKIEDSYYKSKEFQKIIDNVENNINIIKNIVLPKVKEEYNNILLEISKI